MSNYSKLLKDPRWQRKRLEILERDSWMCQQCYSSDKTLHVHHLCYSGLPWDADNKDLKTLCEDCHEIESTARKELEADLILQFRRTMGFERFRHVADVLIRIDYDSDYVLSALLTFIERRLDKNASRLEAREEESIRNFLSRTRNG